jgi:flagellin-like hook-associated protein FlgL
MPLSLNSNPGASAAALNLSRANDALRRSLARLSSGSRIVDSRDDPGGMSVAYKLNSRLRRTAAVKQNVQNSISFLQVQDGALESAGKIVSRMSELRAMAQDVSKNAGDVENYSKEFLELQKQLGQVWREKFNGVELFAISNSQQTLPPDRPALYKGAGQDENGNDVTNFSRRIYTHDGGQAVDGNVSVGVINFEDVFNLGALDTRYVENFTGRFANLSNAGDLNVTNYSTAGAGTASSSSNSTTSEVTGADSSSNSTTPEVTVNIPTGAASARFKRYYTDASGPRFAEYFGSSEGLGHRLNGFGTFNIHPNVAGAIGNNYSFEVVHAEYFEGLDEFDQESTEVTDRVAGNFWPGGFNGFGADSVDGEILGGEQSIIINGKEIRYRMVKLNAASATFPNDGVHDYRLVIERLSDRTGTPYDTVPSLSDFKKMAETGGIFIVDTTNAIDPDNWRIDDTDGIYQENYPSLTSDTYEAAVYADIDSDFNGGQEVGGQPSGEAWVMSFDGGTDTETDGTDTGTDGTGTGTDGTDTGTDGTDDYSASTPKSAAEENSTPDQNAEVFTDNGFLSSILFVSMGQFTSVIERIADARAENGAEQNRLLMVDELLASNMTNLEAAYGRIMDADIAAESTRFAQHNVRVQAAASMVAQANQLSNIALTLLGR